MRIKASSGILDVWRAPRFVRSVVSSRKRLSLTLFFSALFFTAAVLLSQPSFTMSALSRTYLNILFVLRTNVSSIVVSSGITGLLLTAAISFLASCFATATLCFSDSFVSGVLSLPGTVFSGCASCGLGFLPAIGVTGVSLSPFVADAFMFAAVVFLVFTMHLKGSPCECGPPLVTVE